MDGYQNFGRKTSNTDFIIFALIDGQKITSLPQCVLIVLA